VSGFVLDCSIAAAWYLIDEATAETDKLLMRTRLEPVVVPQLWHIELGNVLLQAERRKRVTAAQVTAALDEAALLPIETDNYMTSFAWKETLTLARAEKLTAYDATYLELAMRKGAALATRDETLREAAKRNGVAVLP